MPTIKEKFKNPRLRLYDINKKYICELTGNSLRNSAYSIKRIKKINEIETLSFSIPYDNEYIGLGSCEYLIRHEFAWFIIKNISLSSSDVRVLEVECESNFTISKTIMCENAELIGVSPSEMFEEIMASAAGGNLNYIWKGTDVSSRRSITIESETSVFENLINMAEAFNSIIEMDYDSDGNNTIFLRHNPYDRKKIIRKDRDISQLDINYDTSALFTRVLALGYTDDDGIELNLIDKVGKSYLEDYSYFKEKGMTNEQIANNPQCLAMQVVRYSDIVDVEDLMVAAQEELEKCSRPRVTGSVKFSDLSVLEDCSVIEPILYEKLYIIDKTVNMVFTANITEIEYDYDNILEGNISMDSLISYSSMLKDLVNNSEKVDKITTVNPSTGKPSLIGGLVQGILNTNIVHIAGQLEGIEQPEDKTAILFECRDVSMPELFGALAIGSRGILIADELNPDNSWKWKTAISAKGLSTELVSTIQLVAEQIIAGTLSSVDNSTWINLETGEFNFKDKIKFVDGKYTINLGDDVLTKTEYEQDKNSIITSIDINQLGNWLLDFQKEKEGLYEQYLPLYEDTTNLSTTERNALKQSWDEYEHEYGIIVDLIDSIKKDGVITTEEKEQYNAEVVVYTQKYKSLVSDLQRYWNLCNVHYTNSKISIAQDNIMTSVEGAYIKKTELDNALYYSLSLSKEYQGIPIDADGFPTENVSFETKLSVYKGSQLMNAYTINAINSSDGIVATIDNANKKVTFTKPKTQKFTLTGGTLRVSITIEGMNLYKDLTWSTISPGKDGNEGTPGMNSYVHIMYAPNSNPTAEEMTKIPDIYMGVYTDNTEADSTDPTKYKWSKIRGEDGTSVNIKDTLQSEADLPTNATSGDGYLIGNDLWIMTNVGSWTKVENFKGQDGKSRYIHIKYSDDGGLTFTANGGETTGKYMGVYVDDVELDSTDVLSYTWTQIMGASSYFHVKYAPNNNPTADQMSEYPKEYIGTYVDNIEDDSNDPTKYTWVKLEGKDGVAGKDGINGTTYYFHVKYSNDEGRTFTGNNGEDVGKYIGTLVDTVEKDSNNPTDYKWAKMQGDDGASCKIEFNSNTFNSMDDGNSYSPTSITLTPTFSNCTFSRWYYKRSTSSSWVAINTGTAGLTYNATTNKIGISYSSSLFNGTNREVTFKLTTNNDVIFDIVTITKLTTLENTLSQVEVVSKTVFNQNIDSFKTEVSNTYLKADDASELYSTKSELTQTSTRFEFLFEGSANGNLIINGCPNSKTLHVGWTSTAQVVGTTDYVYIDTYNSSANTEFVSNRFEIKANNTYTLSFKYKAMNNVKTITAYAKIYNVNTGGTPIHSYTLGTLKNDNVWNQFIKSVTPTQSGDALYMSLHFVVTTKATTNVSRNVYIKECMCLLGDTVPEQYVPSNYELIKGKTIITGDGIEVLSGAINIKNNAGKTVWSADDNGNMVMRNGNFYIESTGGYEIASINQNNWMRIQGIHVFGNGECMKNSGKGARSFLLDSTSGETCYIDFNRGLPEETEAFGCRIARLDNTKALTMYASSVIMKPAGTNTSMGLELRSHSSTCYIDLSTDFDADYKGRIYCDNGDNALHLRSGSIVAHGGLLIDRKCTNTTGMLNGVRTHPGTNGILIDSIGLNTADKYVQILPMNSSTIWACTIWQSDISLKKNIVELDDDIDITNLLSAKENSTKKIGLELIKSIKHYEFDFKDNSEHVSCGYISQQLGEVNDELILGVKQGTGEILYQPVEGKIIPHLSKAIQEQQIIIENQQQTIIEQQEKMNELETRLKRLEDLLLNNNNNNN